MLKKIITSVVLGTVLAVPATTVATLNQTQEASAATYTYVEDHSVIDCVHAYKGEWPGYVFAYTFTIKVPKGELNNVTLQTTGSSYGLTIGDPINLSKVDSNHLKYLYSDSTSDYYNYADGYYPGSAKYKSYGAGVKLYYDNGNIHKMATNTSNWSTVEGNGYYLSNN